MNQRAFDQLRHRTGMDGWAFYLVAIPLTLGLVVMAWFTFRDGIWVIIREPKNFYLFLIWLGLVIQLWRARPRLG
jgi:hypothetical protein